MSQHDHDHDHGVTAEPGLVPTQGTAPGHGYWRSLEELAAGGVPAKPDEFPATAADSQSGDLLSRRNFFNLMGASLALAGVAGPGCKRYEKDEIVPLARRPEDQIPGVTQEYAGVLEISGAAHPVVVTSFEGRPIKVDGNPEHPFTGGAVRGATTRHGGSSAFVQASVLSVYDPDRSTSVLQAGKASTFVAFRKWLTEYRAQLQSGAAKVRILSEATSSPTIEALRRKLVEQLPGAVWVEYEALSWDNERAGTRMAFGQPVRPIAKLDQAHTIVALDCDLFIEHPAAIPYSRDFAKGRRGDKPSNRLWAIESTFSSTGAMADHRLPLRSELILPVCQALDAALAGGVAPTSEALAEGKVARFLQVLAEELREQNGKAVLVAGRRQPAQVHALVAKINGAIGAVGNTLTYVNDPEPERQLSHLDAISKLTREMTDKQVETLIILGGNPVYDAPADLGFAAALAGVASTVHLSEHANETSMACAWHVPRAHNLETWTDARTWDGTYTLGQPVILPLYGGVSPAELLSLVLGDEKTGDVLAADTFKALGKGTWRKAVHDGFVADTGYNTVGVALQALAPVTLAESQRAGTAAKNGALEVTFVHSTSTWDGRFANNPWLQETPDFLTKVTWDNYAMVSPATAEALGLSNDTLINVKVGDRNVEVACYTMPGQARGSIALVLGGGRTRAGKVGGNGKAKVGFDTNRVRTVAGFDMASGCSATRTGKGYALASTQEHWDLRQGIDTTIGERGIAKRLPSLVVETTPAKAADPTWTAKNETEYYHDGNRGLSLFEEHPFAQDERYAKTDKPEPKSNHAWAMAIDLSTCTGCNACAVACQAENNVPVVGKDQVQRNREMSWIRIDRYFKGPVDDPEIAHQPIACHHCENAPCEQVCPVGATTHSNEGLNDMAYNRCVGTRYCLNNCPYRVRRFNFLDYHKELAAARNKVRELVFNPEVTVRHRGVMEKCTYCVQRIQNGKIRAKVDGRTLADGDIVTACQAACPTESIVFGDLADKESRVSKLHGDRRAYGLLDAELYTKPRTLFLARVRNPNPKLAPATAAAAGHQGGH